MAKESKFVELKLLPLVQDDFEPGFVGYTRKSTDESTEKQVASIPQQIEALYEYYQKEEISMMPRPKDAEIDQKTLKEIENDNEANKERSKELKAFYVQYWIETERNSAKIPFKRTIWRQLIELVAEGKIRGLLGYSPDRFSRSLQEGGEVIQLADEKKVALRFTNFHYENNAAGQMMLGFWFVFAEHYSKKLSEDVTRGSRKKHMEGKAIGSRKYGYTVDNYGRFIPDPFHFKILKEAFYRKLYDNWSDTKIADEMNRKGWCQPLKEGYNSKMTSQKLSNRGEVGYNVWDDTFYYGVHVKRFKKFKGKEAKVDLRDLDMDDYEFAPLLDEEEWLKLQEVLSDRTHASIVKKQSLKTKRLNPVKPAPNNFVLCAKCNRAMPFSLPNRKRFLMKMTDESKTLEQVVEPHQIKYRCDNKNCNSHGLSLNWDEISDKIISFLKSIKVSEADYVAYVVAKTEELETLHIERVQEQRRVDVLINRTEAEQKKFRKETKFGQTLSGKLKQGWQDQDAEFESKIEELQERKKELRKDVREEIIERQTFVETLKNLHKHWQNAGYVQKRNLLSDLALNIEISSKKRLQVNLKPEIASMFTQSGGPAWI